MNITGATKVSTPSTVFPYGAPSPAVVTPINQDGDEANLYPPVPPALLPVVIGDSGTQRYGGFFREEYSSDWSDNARRVQIVEEMRRGDGTVAQGLKAVKAPMLAAEYEVECGSDDPKDQEIEEWVRQNVFNMDISWKNFLRQALTYLEFGYSVFEQCYKVGPDGKIWLKKLAPRIQDSILKWKLDDGSRGVVQLLRTDEAVNYSVQIPIRKCLVLTNDMEGDDITGIPLIRAAYKHYYIKNNLYQIAAISAERYGVGVPSITLPPGAGDAEKRAAEGIVANLRSNQESHIIKPSKEWEIEIITPKGSQGSSQDIKSQIDHHDRMILQSMLCGFLNLGSTDTGSFALSKDQHSFFLTFVQDRVAYFVEEFNSQVIKPLVDLNFGKRLVYPKLVFTNLGELDKAAMATWLKTLSDAQMIKIDAKMTEWVHNNFQLPPLTEEDMANMEIDEINDQLGDIDPPPEGEMDDQALQVDDSNPEGNPEGADDEDDGGDVDPADAMEVDKDKAPTT